MSRYLLDSTEIIDHLRGDIKTTSLLSQLNAQGDDLGTSAINVAEVFAGMRPEEEKKTRHFIDSLIVFEINGEIAKKAGLIKGELTRKKIKTTLADVLIAQCTIENEALLLTKNLDDFKVFQGLKIYKGIP